MHYHPDTQQRYRPNAEGASLDSKVCVCVCARARVCVSLFNINRANRLTSEKSPGVCVFVCVSLFIPIGRATGLTNEKTNFVSVSMCVFLCVCVRTCVSK